MNNQQLYVAIGIPCLLAILNTGVVVTLLLHFTNRLDSRMDRLESRMDRLENRIDVVRTEVLVKFDGLQKDMREFYATSRQHETRLDAIERKTNTL